MTRSLLFLVPLMVLASIVTMVIQRQSILMALLALEAMILSLALMTTLTVMAHSPTKIFLCLILLTLGACEAALGLACLVSMMRSYGSDQIKTLSLNKC
uniref:NADH dehydrogenase subunit 4L n=1 Tax=Synelmis amoureuxi TaxID=3053537 RepID=UPI0030DF1C81